MPSYIMQILVEDIEAEDENEAMVKFIKHLTTAFKLEVNIFVENGIDDEDAEFLCTHAIIRGEGNNDSGSIH